MDHHSLLVLIPSPPSRVASSRRAVLELATGGSLFERIGAKCDFTERDAADIIRQLAEAVQFMHSNNIVHRDLKPENLLLRDPQTFIVKVADFGLSIFVDTQATFDDDPNDHALLMKTACGTRFYAAPEILCKEPYDQSVDVWSLGVIMATLLTGVHPLNTQWRINNTQGEFTENAPFINAVLDGTYVHELKQDSLLEFDDSELWDPVSEPAKRLVEKTMVADPRLRASPAEILADPWISENAAPITPLPNVLGRLQRLKLDGLQKLMLRVMSQKTENDALFLEAQHLFAELDVEQKGTVRKVDLAGLLRTQSGTSVYRAHIDAIFDSLDVEGTGQVTVRDLQAALLIQHGALMESLTEPLFRQLDKHGRGKVSAGDISHALGEMGSPIDEEEVQGMITSQVKRKDKARRNSITINLPEFMDLMLLGGGLTDPNPQSRSLRGSGEIPERNAIAALFLNSSSSEKLVSPGRSPMSGHSRSIASMTSSRGSSSGEMTDGQPSSGLGIPPKRDATSKAALERAQANASRASKRMEEERVKRVELEAKLAEAQRTIEELKQQKHRHAEAPAPAPE